MSKIIETASQFLAHRKGLLPLLGCLLVLVNLVLRVAAPDTWFAATDVFLHLGVLTAIFGLLLARVL